MSKVAVLGTRHTLSGLQLHLRRVWVSWSPVSYVESSTTISNILWHLKQQRHQALNKWIPSGVSLLKKHDWRGNVTDYLGTLQDEHPQPRAECSRFLTRTRRNEQTEGLKISRRKLYSTQRIIVLLNSSPQADVEAKHINEFKKELENNHWRKIYLDAKKCMWPATQEVPKLQSASNCKYATVEALLNKTSSCSGLRGLIYSLRVLAIEYLSGKTQETWCHPPTTLLPKNTSRQPGRWVLTVVLEQGAPQWRKDVTRVPRVHLSCSPCL